MERKKRRGFKCYWCGADITFDKGICSENGKRIPLNPDGTKHDCPQSPYNLRKRRLQGSEAA